MRDRPRTDQPHLSMLSAPADPKVVERRAKTAGTGGDRWGVCAELVSLGFGPCEAVLKTFTCGLVESFRILIADQILFGFSRGFEIASSLLAQRVLIQ